MRVAKKGGEGRKKEKVTPFIGFQFPRKKSVILKVRPFLV